MHSDLLTSFAVALVAAFSGGFIAVRIGLPPIVGYLLAGVAIGPFTPGFTADQDVAAELAEIGVVLLMFGVGIHFSLRELLAVQRIAVPGAVGQITVATTLTVGAFLAFGWTLGQALVLGLAVSVASTVVLLRALEVRGQLDTVQGHVAVGWLIVEDLFTVLVLVLLPALAVPLGGHAPDGAGEPIVEISLALVKAAAFVALMLFLGPRLIPSLLTLVARTGSRELFTLGVLAIALGIAFGSSEIFGVSLALGAFLAGVVISEDIGHQAAVDALPMRDAFAVLFFVSVGMLFDPAAIIDMPLQIAILIAIVILGKSLAAFAIVTAFRYPPGVGLTVAAGLAQVGEFSFILIALADTLGLIPSDGTNLVLAAALFSIALNPLVFAAIDPLEEWLYQKPFMAGIFSGRAREQAAETPNPGLRGHAVICGFGQAGSVVGRALGRRGFRYIVVERDRRLVESLRENGIPAVYGDASQPAILKHTELQAARLLIVTIRDPLAARRIVAYAQSVNRDLDIVVRTTSEAERAFLNTRGVGEAVLGDWEVGLELTRRALHRFGVSSQETGIIIQGLRSGSASSR